MNKNKCTKWKSILNIKTKIESLSIKELILLYLIVVLLYVFIYILHVNNKNTNEFFINTSLPNSSNKKIKKYTDIELLTYFTQLSKKYNIIIDEVKIFDNSIEIRTEETYQNIMTFLSIVSKNFNIKNFEIKKEQKKLKFFIRLDKSMLFPVLQNSKIQKDIKNPFIKNSTEISEEIPNVILSAIINDEVLIDNFWYKKGDKIYDYKIDSILGIKNKVIFVNVKTDKKITKSINYE